MPIRYQYQPDELPVAAVSFQPDEDYWLSLSPSFAPFLVQPQWTFDAQELPSPLAFVPDEDYWMNSIAKLPTSFCYFQPWQADQSEIVVSSSSGSAIWLPYWGLPLSRLTRG